jgi:hypothetical protein
MRVSTIAAHWQLYRREADLKTEIETEEFLTNMGGFSSLNILS